MSHQELDPARQPLLVENYWQQLTCRLSSNLVDCFSCELAQLLRPVGDRLLGEQGGLLPGGEVLADLLPDVVALEDLHHPVMENKQSEQKGDLDKQSMTIEVTSAHWCIGVSQVHSRMYTSVTLTYTCQICKYGTRISLKNIAT